jgi:hypothetical protein
MVFNATFNNNNLNDKHRTLNILQKLYKENEITSHFEIHRK